MWHRSVSGFLWTEFNTSLTGLSLGPTPSECNLRQNCSRCSHSQSLNPSGDLLHPPQTLTETCLNWSLDSTKTFFFVETFGGGRILPALRLSRCTRDQALRNFFYAGVTGAKWCPAHSRPYMGRMGVLLATIVTHVPLRSHHWIDAANKSPVDRLGLAERSEVCLLVRERLTAMNWSCPLFFVWD